jgi:hypothetical protein
VWKSSFALLPSPHVLFHVEQLGLDDSCCFDEESGLSAGDGDGWVEYEGWGQGWGGGGEEEEIDGGSGMCGLYGGGHIVYGA